jgi:hypothetical protein
MGMDIAGWVEARGPFVPASPAAPRLADGGDYSTLRKG